MCIYDWYEFKGLSRLLPKIKSITKINNNELEKEERTLELMNYLGIDKNKLKK